jgi:hypothetical protein
VTASWSSVPLVRSAMNSKTKAAPSAAVPRPAISPSVQSRQLTAWARARTIVTIAVAASG